MTSFRERSVGVAEPCCDKWAADGCCWSPTPPLSSPRPMTVPSASLTPSESLFPPPHCLRLTSPPPPPPSPSRSSPCVPVSHVHPRTEGRVLVRGPAHRHTAPIVAQSEGGPQLQPVPQPGHKASHHHCCHPEEISGLSQKNKNLKKTLQPEFKGTAVKTG